MVEASLPFEITFPALIPVTEDEAPELIEIDGNVCLCLFTDLPSLDRFRTTQPARLAQRTTAVWSFRSADALSEFLLANESGFEAHGCAHIAVNSSPEEPLRYAPFHTFIEYLKACRGD